MKRDENGRFKKGETGFWSGKRRKDMECENNPKWVGSRNNHVSAQCKAPFRRPKTKDRQTPRFCSQKCYWENKKISFSGESNPLWKGGITEVNDKIRKSDEYKDWRLMVYKRDRYTCQICKRHLQQLIAHHIKTFEKYPELRFELSNGITLCRACHCKLHAENIDTHNFTKILNDYTTNIPKG